MTIDSLKELEFWIDSQPKDKMRSVLLEEFDSVTEYEDFNQWATAVRLCESLSILGWGEREAVDAISRYNGDCWETKFVTDRDECRFRFARWSKRKAGWILWNPEYYYSPDFPQKPDVDWKQYSKIDFPIVSGEKLASQRNYRKQMPIIMGLYGSTNKTSDIAWELKRQLTEYLYDSMTPSLYGDAIENFYFTLNCSALSETFDSLLKIGAYNLKRKSFYADLYFDDAFGNLQSSEQREYFSTNLLKAIDALGVKFKKRKIEYDIHAFRDDVLTAISKWNKQA